MQARTLVVLVAALGSVACEPARDPVPSIDSGIDSVSRPCGPEGTLCTPPGSMSLCVNLNKDPEHCGGCLKACAPGQTCSWGYCSGDASVPRGDGARESRPGDRGPG